MATNAPTKPSGGSGSVTTHTFDTPETIQYINSLHKQWNEAEAQLSKYTDEQKLLKKLEANNKSELTLVKKATDTAKSHFADIKIALDKVTVIVNFFKNRLQITKNMAAEAKSVSVATFNAADELNRKAQDRVELVKAAVDEFNDSDKAKLQPDIQWNSRFISSITEAEAAGILAFEAVAKAVISSFKAYVSNQEIHTRTQSYRDQFLKFEQELRVILIRKSQELAMLEMKEGQLSSKEKSLEMRLSDVTAKVSEFTFLASQYHAEFNAAHIGAQYKYTPPKSSTSWWGPICARTLLVPIKN